jgi:spore coat protein U-like protein
MTHSAISSMNVKAARRRIAAVCVVASVLCAPFFQRAVAGSVSGALEVRLQLAPSCDFITGDMDAALLDFGRTGGNQPLEAIAISTKDRAIVRIACSSSYTGANAPVMTVSYGMHAQGSQRYLLGPHNERIAYNLYADPARHIPLDPTAPLQLLIPAAGVITAIPIYGRIPFIGDPAAGRYTDVVWLTLSY